MKIKKKLMGMLSCLLVATILPVQVYASESVQPYERTYYSKENNTEVIIESNAYNMPEEDISEIVRENPNTRIIISNYVEAEPMIQPRLVMGVEITQKNTTQSNYVDKDSFVISVAKGSKVTLSETWTQSLAASVTHKEAKNALKLNGTITKTYTKTKSFSGPPENSAYNSREYRVKFYADKGTYKGYYITDMGRGPSISGSFKNPLRYAEYSIDKKI